MHEGLWNNASCPIIFQIVRMKRIVTDPTSEFLSKNVAMFNTNYLVPKGNKIVKLTCYKQ
jgi:hypothetical protein